MVAKSTEREHNIAPKGGITMKTFKTMLRGIRGWAREFAEALRGYDLEPLQSGDWHEETLVLLTPLGPAVVPMWRAGTSGNQGEPA